MDYHSNLGDDLTVEELVPPSPSFSLFSPNSVHKSTIKRFDFENGGSEVMQKEEMKSYETVVYERAIDLLKGNYNVCAMIESVVCRFLSTQVVKRKHNFFLVFNEKVWIRNFALLCDMKLLFFRRTRDCTEENIHEMGQLAFSASFGSSQRLVHRSTRWKIPHKTFGNSLWGTPCKLLLLSGCILRLFAGMLN